MPHVSINISKHVHDLMGISNTYTSGLHISNIKIDNIEEMRNFVLKDYIIASNTQTFIKIESIL